MENSNKKRENHTSHRTLHTSQKGITLIALIITIIVMLILVGVTINVALNGGLFEKGEKAAFQTEASMVKEELEIAKALKVMNAEGKPVDDYSDITVGNLEGLDLNTQIKFRDKIVVNKAGDICYNPEKVTDEEEKEWLEEIGIIEYINGGSTAETFTFKLADIVPNATFSSRIWTISEDSFWPSSVSNELKNDTEGHPELSLTTVYRDIVCYNNETQVPDVSLQSSGEISNGFVFWRASGKIMIGVIIDNIQITSSNYTNYDIEFTITKTAS